MADSDDDIQFQSFDNYFAGLPAATTPIGTEPMLVYQSGTTKQVPANSVGTIGRTLLTANMNFYVSVLGSDSNPGSLAQPWATLQHAMFFIAAMLDIGGFTITVNVGVGSFVGFGYASCVGGGLIQFFGHGPSSTTITGGPNDGVFNFGDCFDVEFISDTGVQFDGVNFAIPDNGFSAVELDVFNPNILIGGAGLGITFTFTGGTSPGSNVLVCFVPGSVITVAENFTIDATVGGTQFSIWNCHQGGKIIINGAGTILGALTIFASEAFANIGTDGILLQQNLTAWVGSATGQRYLVLSRGSILPPSNQPPGSLGSNFFPGNLDGFVDVSSSYDGFDGAQRASGLPTTTQFPDAGTGGLYKDTSGGGVYIVYNDAGTIKKAQLT